MLKTSEHLKHVCRIGPFEVTCVCVQGPAVPGPKPPPAPASVGSQGDVPGELGTASAATLKKRRQRMKKKAASASKDKASDRESEV